MSTEPRKCPSCGAFLHESVSVCADCGADMQSAAPAPPPHAPVLSSSSTPGPTASSPSSQNASSAQSPYDDDPGKRIGFHPSDSYVSPNTHRPKRGHTVLILAIVAAVCAVGIFIFYSWEGEVNYIGSVKAWTPFRQSHELSYSVGQVLNRYMPNAVWTEKEGSGNSVVVEASGELLGAEGIYTFEFVVTPDENNRGSAAFRVQSVTRDGHAISPSDPAVPLLYLFSVRREGLDDAAGILEAAEAAAELAPEAVTPGA